MKYRRLTKYYLLRFLRIATQPFPAAGGFACGTIIHFFPTSGFGLPAAVFLSKLTKTSAVASSLAWALTMPLFPFMFYCNFLTGDLILQKTTKNIYSAVQKLACLDFIQFIKIGKAFIIGGLLNSFFCLIFLWMLLFFFLKRFRKQALNLVTKFL